MKIFKPFLLISLLFLAAAATFAQNSGSAGSLHWEYNPADSTLTITGNGAMPDYDYLTRRMPWYYLSSSVKYVNIESGVTSIGDYAFFTCRALKAVTIPNSVTSIGHSAFSSCSILTEITIPESVTAIDVGAFMHCISLKEITIPNSVTTIDNAAFSGCTSLKEITIPESVTLIGSRTFDADSSLTAITVAAGNPNYSSENGILFNKDKTTLMQYPAGKTETAYTIPNSVVSIGNQAFENCTSLTDITIPNSTRGIEYSAFAGCTSLTKVTIPKSVTAIHDLVFGGCTSLKEITIPESVTAIGHVVFSNCSKLTDITVAAGNPNYSSENGVLLNKNKTILIDCPKGKTGTYAIPRSVTAIEDAFRGCSKLTEVTIPESVTVIDNAAFTACTSLMAITVAADNPVWSSENGVLFSKDKTTLILCPEGKSAYTIPNSVTTIGGSAFDNCTSLKEVIIGNSVTTIGRWAFRDCISLKEVAIPNSVDTIEYMAFRDCSSLTKVTIGNSVKVIGAYAFMGCSLTEITIPESVTFIGAYAFDLLYPASLLFTVTCYAETPPQFGQNTGMLSYNYTTLYVPAGLVELYRNADGWRLIKTIVAIGSLTGVSLNKTQLSLNVGARDTLTASVTPANAANQTVLFISSNNAVATVNYTTGEVMAVSAGTATVTVITADGEFTATCEVTVKEGTGIVDQSSFNFNLYPNPVQNELRVESGELRIENIEILDLSGKTILTFSNPEDKVDVSYLSAGVYFIKINTDKGIVTEKFVKK